MSGPQLVAQTAAGLMTPSPLSVGTGATVEEVAAFLTETGLSAAPVLNEAGRPVGVIDRASLLCHERWRAGQRALPGAHATPHVTAKAEDLMAPAFFAVKPETPARAVAEQMVALDAPLLFVMGDAGVLVGVVTALDLLRHMSRAA